MPVHISLRLGDELVGSARLDIWFTNTLVQECVHEPGLFGFLPNKDGSYILKTNRLGRGQNGWRKCLVEPGQLLAPHAQPKSKGLRKVADWFESRGYELVGIRRAPAPLCLVCLWCADTPCANCCCASSDGCQPTNRPSAHFHP